MTTTGVVSTRLGSVRAMACDVVVHGTRDTGAAAADAVARALACAGDVDRACTRFDPKSALMRANARPDRWHEVPEILFRSVQEAHRAYQRTHGLFDPRILTGLVALGYDRSFEGGGGAVPDRVAASAPPPRGQWRPQFRGGPRPRLHLGGQPVDLGGIGKGLALRWGAQRLHGALDDFLLEAGGDCVCAGSGPDGGGWRVGVESPHGDVGNGPLAVVEVQDLACATSSVRLRRWRNNGKTVHHLIDPRTGRPGGAGLSAVTVIASDPADAEVLSKTLFLHGRRGIAAAAARAGASALWVCSDGTIGESAGFSTHVIWRRR